MNLAGKRILIIKQSSLGDIIHTLPVAHALKRCFPGCRIGWIVQRAFADLLRQDDAVDRVYPITIPSTSDPQAGRLAYLRAFSATLDTLRDLRRLFRREPYDLVLDLHASFRSGLLGMTCRRGVRIGFADARELNPLFQDDRIEVPRDVVHAVDRNLLFCRHLGCRVKDEDFFLSCDRQHEEDVHRFLAQHGVSGHDLLVYASPTARWQTKFWPARNWAQLADELYGTGVRLVFAGTDADREFIAAITAMMHTPPLNAAGRLDLAGAVALIRRSALYVGLDTGPMHMAAMAGRPVVALFGPTHPERVGPYGVPHCIVRAAGVECLGCRRRQCRQLRCMEEITVSQVLAAVQDLLAGGPGTGEEQCVSA